MKTVDVHRHTAALNAMRLHLPLPRQSFYAKFVGTNRGNRHQTHRKLQLHRNCVIQWINCYNLKLFNDSHSSHSIIIVVFAVAIFFSWFDCRFLSRADLHSIISGIVLEMSRFFSLQFHVKPPTGQCKFIHERELGLKIESQSQMEKKKKKKKRKREREAEKNAHTSFPSTNVFLFLCWFILRFHLVRAVAMWRKCNE